MPIKQPEYRYQLTITAFKRSDSDIAFHDTINSNSLIDILGRLPLIIATIVKAENEQEKLCEKFSAIANDEDIPF